MNGPLIMAAAFVFAMAIGVPIPFAAGLATVAGLLIADIPLTLMAQAAWTAFEPFPLVTIPLFILAGQLMEQGGMSEKLVTIAKRLVGAYKGGMGLVTVVACMFFAALSGSGPATTAAIGSITIPAMQKEGYRSRFAGAIAASAGALGSMIPPSNLLIIFALVTDVSIPRLFLAGILPGLILGLMLMVVVFVISWKNGYGGTEDRFRWGPLLWALWDGKWAVFAPVLILGGIYAGIFTPSEAAAVAVAYGLFVGLFVYKGLTWAKLLHAFKFAPLTTALMVSARADPAVETMPDTASSEELALAMAKAVARRAVLDWEGVGDDAGNVVPVTPQGIDALLEIWPVFEAIQTSYVARGLILDAEKSASTPLPSGPSAGASATAKPAKSRAKTARRG